YTTLFRSWLWNCPAQSFEYRTALRASETYNAYPRWERATREREDCFFSGGLIPHGFCSTYHSNALTGELLCGCPRRTCLVTKRAPTFYNIRIIRCTGAPGRALLWTRRKLWIDPFCCR